jgi:hypothetical protein
MATFVFRSWGLTASPQFYNAAARKSHGPPDPQQMTRRSAGLAFFQTCGFGVDSKQRL